MDSLYLLIPLSVLLVLAIGGLLVWSVLRAQFDDLDAEGRRILRDDDPDAKLADSVNGQSASSVRKSHDGTRRDGD